MKCEGSRTAMSNPPCQVTTRGYELFNYCEHCSKNLCSPCMDGRCSKSPTGRHVPSGGDDE